MTVRSDRLRDVAVVVGTLAIAVVAVSAGWFLFVTIPDDGSQLAGVLLVIFTGLAAVKAGNSLLSELLDDYDVAAVAVDTPIVREGGRSVPLSAPIRPTADEIIGEINRADQDPNVEALLVRLDTPGGEVLPSEDIRRAVDRFDGPTIAHAGDVCASGGYWIAAGCEEIWAHEASLVGSIGVRGSRPNAAELAEKLGIRYEQLAAGEFKEAGNPLSEMDDEERAYLQGIVDDLYAQFVETVSEGRDLDPETVRETEARVFLGEEAKEWGLVDEIGTDADVETRLSDRLDRPVEIREFSPERGLADRLQAGARSVAYGLGAGVASVVSDESASEIDVRVR
ncbi:signal peptide peptidase SppA [Halopenitus sp. H-Gu1]|uniref:signal peptide peptidase SppA n=1 Tax=Halopenitus sp. H-Gu1 TaxID=3242697 RepID=UPI00359DFB26